MHLHSKTAQRYAKALFALAAPVDAVEPVLADLTAVRALLAGSPDLARFFGNYLLPRRLRQDILTRMVASAGLHPLSAKFLLFLEAKKRLGRVDEIGVAFQELRDQQAGIVKGRLTSAFPMESPEVAAVTDRVQVRVGGTLDLTMEVDPALLGGCRVRVDDLLFDLSLATRLQTLRRRTRTA